MTMYPVTKRTTEALRDADVPIEGAVKAMVDTLGEYEHGTAEVSDVAPGMTLELYAAVVLDLALCLAAMEE